MNRPKLTMLITTFVVLFFVGSSLSRSVQDEISSEEWAKLFPLSTTTATEYEYDIIPIHPSKIQKRDVDGKKGTHIQIKAFGEHIKLWLNPVDGVLAGTNTPIYKIYEHFDIIDVTNTMHNHIMFFYENVPEATTMMINETPDGRTELNGIIGARNLYVRPIPPHYMKRYKKSINVNETEFDDHAYHIAFKVPGELNDLKDIKAPLTKALRSKRSLPETLYVELLLFVDYPWYIKWDNDVQVMAYLLSFWNAVDLRYRSLENPKVRLNIAAIMIAADRRALSYMAENHLEHEPYGLLIDDAWHASFKWLARFQKYFNINYDAAITITSDVLTTYRNGKYKKGGTDGIASIGGICNTVEKYESHGRIEEILDKSAIVYDDGTYKTILTAAHELGHVLGAIHDGVENNTACKPESGYIMSPSDAYQVKTNNSADWSPCSLENFQKRFENDVSCLYNVPKVGIPFTPLLPGRIYTANEQCRKMYGTEAAFIDESTCRKLVCVSSYHRLEYDYYQGAADGTRCGDGKICLHSRCIRESDITF